MCNAQQTKNWFKESLNNKNLVEKLKKIKLIVTDVDGCLTNGTVSMSGPDGEISKSFSVVDGFAIDKTVSNSKLLIAFLSARKDIVTKIRAQKLGLDDDMCIIEEGSNLNKKLKIEAIQKNKNILTDETLIFGDDFLDFEAKSAAGVFACPQNTLFYFQEVADLILPLPGSQSSFRLLLDLVLYVQNKHFAQKYIEESLKR
jgi:3-deoxy-D-manno-octulosonate 8-phosphate phosphatase (KDO 8-P phosphatase)